MSDMPDEIWALPSTDNAWGRYFTNSPLNDERRIEAHYIRADLVAERDATIRRASESAEKADALIHEQQAEIERLRADNATLRHGARLNELSLMGEIERLRGALQEINDTQGKVCVGFELCTHESCRSSYSSWVIADTALRGEKP